MINVFEMRLADEPFEKMGRDDKTVEIRLYDDKRKKIKIGDEIVFRNVSDESNVMIADVKDLHRFNTFKELFSSDLFPKTGFGELSKEAATEYMYNFYSKEQEREFGVLGIEIRLNKDLTFVYKILKDEYKDCKITDDDIMLVARRLYERVFVEDCSLNEILDIVYEFEEAMRAKRKKIRVGHQCVIYSQMIDNLEINENNAKRLYDSFLFYRDCLAFSLLMTQYEEWVTPEQRQKLISIAKEEFIESVWEDYV